MNGTLDQWDVFISYASEDRLEVAVPLAEALSRIGLRVWLDVQQLVVGDRLRQKIDSAIAASLFGVVILSPSSMRKQWPAAELSAFFASESPDRARILPVWHGIDHQQVCAFAPLLADRKAANTREGVDRVAEEIARSVRVSTEHLHSPSRAQLLLASLERGTRGVCDFLLAQPRIATLLCDKNSSNNLEFVEAKSSLPPGFHCLFARNSGEGTVSSDYVILLGPPEALWRDTHGGLSSAATILLGIGKRILACDGFGIDAVRAACESWATASISQTEQPSCNFSFDLHCLMGKRQVASEQKHFMQQLNRESQIYCRSYGAVLDMALLVDAASRFESLGLDINIPRECILFNKSNDGPV